MAKYSIVIPTHNHLNDCLIPCLNSIIKNTDMDDTEIIVVANGCTDGTNEYIEQLSKDNKAVNPLWFKDALGYTKATNIGIQQSRGEYVVLLNNDTIVLDWQQKSDWLKAMELPFLSRKVAVTGPSKIYFSPGEQYTGMRNGRTNGEWFVVFFCAMIKRNLFNELGLLDEQFSPGYGEDIDWCMRAIEAGYTVEQVPNDNIDEWSYATSFPIYHKPESTFLDEQHRHLAQGWYEKGIKLVSERYCEETGTA